MSPYCACDFLFKCPKSPTSFEVIVVHRLCTSLPQALCYNHNSWPPNSKCDYHIWECIISLSFNTLSSRPLFFFFFFGWASSSRLFSSQVPIIIIIFSLPAIGRIIFAPEIYWSFQCFARYATEAGQKMWYIYWFNRPKDTN